MWIFIDSPEDAAAIQASVILREAHISHIYGPRAGDTFNDRAMILVDAQHGLEVLAALRKAGIQAVSQETAGRSP
jgi:hypothetical protein